MEDDRHRVHLQSEGIAEEKQKYVTVLRTNPKESTSLLKQNVNIGKARGHLKQAMAGGTDAVATTKHLDFPTAKRMASIGLIEARHRKRWKRKKEQKNFPSLQIGKTRTLTNVLESAAQLRETESVI